MIEVQARMGLEQACASVELAFDPHTGAHELAVVAVLADLRTDDAGVVQAHALVHQLQLGLNGPAGGDAKGLAPSTEASRLLPLPPPAGPSTGDAV